MIRLCSRPQVGVSCPSLLVRWPFEMNLCSLSWKVNRARRCQVPPMRTPVTVWERQNDLIYTPGRRVWINVLSPFASSETADMGRGRSGAPQRESSWIYGEVPCSVQASEHSEQCGDICARSRWRRHAQVQSRSQSPNSESAVLKARRHQQALFNMLPINRHLFGKSSSSAGVATFWCARISDYQV